MAPLLYLQDKVKQQRPPLIGRVLHPHLLGGWYLLCFLGPGPLVGLSHLSAPFLARLGSWHIATGSPFSCLLPVLVLWHLNVLGLGADWTSRVRLALSAWRGSSRSLAPPGGAGSPRVASLDGSRRLSPCADSNWPCRSAPRGVGLLAAALHGDSAPGSG